MIIRVVEMRCEVLIKFGELFCILNHSTIGHRRVTISHLRLTSTGYLKATITHMRVTLGHLRVTLGHLWVTLGIFFSISNHKANTTELHPKVRKTCLEPS